MIPAPLFYAAMGCAAAAALSWLLSLVTGEHSWVDRLWSIMPPAYVGWYASNAGFDDGRLLLMTALALAWGARLSFNFWRRGGYARGGEDYRWAELRKTMSPASFQLFAFIFVACFQHALLFLIAAPAWVALAHRGAPLGPLDAVAAGLFLLLLAGETIADEQQWRFQRDKKARMERGEPIAVDFIATGLFRCARHPNYFCEQALWWAFYLFAVAASGRWLHGWLVGPILLVALFAGSTRFTEQLSLAKYPAYADYQRRVPRFLPLPRRRS